MEHTTKGEIYLKIQLTVYCIDHRSLWFMFNDTTVFRILICQSSSLVLLQYIHGGYPYYTIRFNEHLRRPTFACLDEILIGNKITV